MEAKSKMGHLKRLFAPRQWNIARKDKKYIIRPFPSGHSRELSLPLLVVLRDLLGHVQSARELRHVLRQKDILVDGKKQTNERASLGLFDVLNLDGKDFYRLMLGHAGKMELITIDKKESTIKICKIIGKRMTRGGKTQITLHDGRSLLTDKKVKCGDSVVLSLPDIKISDVLPFQKGAAVYLTKGKHAGSSGTLHDIQGTSVMYEDKSKNKTQTLKKYVIVTGKDKAFIKTNERK
jgi:small subunit ribosomal protein S4e